MPHTKQAIAKPFVKRFVKQFWFFLFLHGLGACGGDNSCTSSKNVPDAGVNGLTAKDKNQNSDTPDRTFQFNPEVKSQYDPELKRQSHHDDGYDSGYESDHNANKKPHHTASSYGKPDKGDNPGIKSNHLSDSSTKLDNKFHSGMESDNESNADIKSIDIEKFIEDMRTKSDEGINISWELSGDQLIRHVKNRSPNSKSLETSADYFVVGLSIYRAGRTICELHGLEGGPLKRKAKEFCKYYEYIQATNSSSHHPENKKMTRNDWRLLMSRIDKAVIQYLQKHFFSREDEHKVAKKLRLTENYAGLNDMHCDITTKFKIHNYTFALEDKKCFPLTEKQKKAYRKRKSEPWYQRLEPFEQKLIDKFLPQLLSLGTNYFLPTQIRDNVGLRNGYKKRILECRPDGATKVLATYYHSGSLVSPTHWDKKAYKEADREITADNWEQIKNEAVNMEVLSLNYNLDAPILLHEKKIVKDTKKAVGENRFLNISVNIPGTLGNVKQSINKLIKDAVNEYKKKYKNLPLDANKSVYETSALKMIQESCTDPKDKKFFEYVLKLHEFNNSSSFAHLGHNIMHMRNVNKEQNDNGNAKLAAEYVASKAILTADNASDPLLFHCKSGKDRTGVVMLLADGIIIHIHHPELTLQEIYTEIVATRHIQKLAGRNGGMPGREGVKNISLTKDSSHCKDLLCLPTANLTKISATKENVEEIKENVEENR